MPAATSDSTTLPPPIPKPAPSSFPQFLNLPLEIREMIWKFALPGPRELLMPKNLGGVFPDLREFKMPLSRVCFESRRVMKMAGYEMFWNCYPNCVPKCPCPRRGVWFSRKRGDKLRVEDFGVSSSN
ncbi:hypothetical protein F4679DRAFT_600087 [Xylaria curta]|nr:hypothetical protein F4679DRAFT_600087 [Xylaria curta]